MPGLATFKGLVLGLIPYALVACVAAFLIGAILWAVGAFGHNPQHSSRGKTTLIVALVAALLVGGAAYLVGWFNDVGQDGVGAGGGDAAGGAARAVPVGLRRGDVDPRAFGWPPSLGARGRRAGCGRPDRGDRGRGVVVEGFAGEPRRDHRGRRSSAGASTGGPRAVDLGEFVGDAAGRPAGLDAGRRADRPPGVRPAGRAGVAGVRPVDGLPGPQPGSAPRGRAGPVRRRGPAGAGSGGVHPGRAGAGLDAQATARR